MIYGKHSGSIDFFDISQKTNLNGEKERDSKVALRKNKVGLKLNGTHQLLVCADNVILLLDNIDTTKRNTTLIDASKDVVLEVNSEKTKYMLCLITRMHGKIIT
jgi:hypothetical protein